MRITTNGKKLASMPDEFYELARNIKLVVDITRYPESSGINYDDVIKRLKDEQITVINKAVFLENTSLDTEVTHFCRRMLKCSKEKTQSFPDGKPFALCTHRCPSLWLGRLFKCSDLAFINTLNDNFGTDFEVVQNSDYILAKNIKSFNDITKLITAPGAFCNTYCKYSRFVSYEPWSIGKNTKDEILFK